jgi:hypothetical protein
MYAGTKDRGFIVLGCKLNAIEMDVKGICYADIIELTENS